MYGCKGVRVYGCTGVRVYGCTGVRVYGCVRVQGCKGARVQGCKGARVLQKFWRHLARQNSSFETLVAAGFFFVFFDRACFVFFCVSVFFSLQAVRFDL